MADFNIQNCSATFELVLQDDYPNRFFYIIGTANHPTYGKVATLRGFIIGPRLAWKQAGDFLEAMDGESDKLMHFSVDIFDDNTNIHPWLIDGGHRSGSGCWGQELNKGVIVYLEDLTVEEQFLRHGVGSWLLQQFLHSPHVQGSLYFNPNHVYCGPTGPPGPGATQSTNQQIVTSFFQKNGFRRIGRTNFLCYSTNPNHRSHELSIANDPTPLSQEFSDTSTLSPEEMVVQYPLHFSIASNKDMTIVEIIKAAFSVDPANIHKAGPDSCTPTHLAAEAGNVHALRTLLGLGVGDDLRNAENKQGTTPLETLQSRMKSNRQFMETILGVWDGYSADELTCEYLLMKAMDLNVSARSESDHIEKRKLGCTCGQCTDGWLSPRMRYRLSAEAISHHESHTDELSSMRGRHSSEEYLESVLMLDKDYLPSSLHSQVTKGFCTAWLSLFRSIYDIVESPGQIPTPERVASHSAAYDFFAKGGKAEYAIDATTSWAKEQSPLGDGSFMEEDHESYSELPTCQNDLAFGLVRRRLGLDPRVQWGPYYTYPGPSGDDDDDDDDMYDSDD